MTDKEYLVTDGLPNDGQKVLAFGYRTMCCAIDKAKKRDWHEVIFSFDVIFYELKESVPQDIEESILKDYACQENWTCTNDEDYPDYLLGVTKWKIIE